MHFFSLLFMLLLSMSCSTLYAQTTNDTIQAESIVIIKMKNGDEFKGVIVQQNEESILLKTVNGEINLIASQIKSVENQDYTGKFNFEYPHDTRYFFGPSGIPLKKKKAYYQNILVTTNFINYGLTKNISVGGGFEFISTIMGSPIWFLTPKVGFQISDKIHAGGGILLAGFSDEGIATLGYGVATYGKSETNVSLGVGYGLFNNEFSKYPAMMLSGTHRVSNSIALLSENYVFPNASGEAMYVGVQGIRILSKKNSFDIGGMVIPAISNEIPVIPYVGYVRIF